MASVSMTTDYDEELHMVESELASIEADLQTLLQRQSELLDKQAELKAIIEQHVTKDKQTKDASFWSKTNFEWSSTIDEKLKSVFHLKELRPMQLQTMNATLSGEDALLIMPTGGGKSLCFQLPALVKKGFSLVISPLISLMEDQLISLERLGVPSAVLNASTSKEEQKFILDDIVNVNGKLRLLYVTPEKLAKSKRFMNKLEKSYAIGHLSRLVIDEVHCCSQWGHDFRPDYKFLGIMKRQFPNAPILGLTATATTKVLEDVKKILSIPKALVLKASFNRPNLFYEVHQKPASQKECVDAIHDLISTKYRNQSGIVYCFSRKDTEELCASLQSLGVKAGCYHGDLDAKVRSKVHSRWLSDDIHVVVATIAFGMGIDKPDVRFVIHQSISKSMENLYQESGRAGRDGGKADCIVFYRLADVVRQSTMVFTEQTGLTNLYGIVKYCIDVASCRRSLIARHFGEVWQGSDCNEMCDHCKILGTSASVEKRDVTRHCVDIVALLDVAASADQRVTAIKLVDAWFGKGPSALRVKSITSPSMSRDKAERILAHMLTNGFVQEDFHFTAYSTICYLVPGSKAKLLRNKSVKVCLDYCSKTMSKSAQSSSKSLASASSTSASSSSPLKKKISSDSPEKPKVVVINREKSHFNSLSFVTSLPSSTDSIGSGPERTHNESLGKECSNSQHQNVSSSDEEELNFDDDSDRDRKFERKSNVLTRKEKQSKLNNSNSENSSKTKNAHSGKLDARNSNSNRDLHGGQVSSGDEQQNHSKSNSGKSVKGKSVPRTKRKQIIISDSSDDTDEVPPKKLSKKVPSSSAARNDLNLENSFVISDDDSEDDFIK